MTHLQDLILNFIMPYFDTDAGEWVTQHSRIAWLYLRYDPSPITTMPN